QGADARNCGAIAVLALRQAPGRILVVAQGNRIMVAVERQRDRDPRSVLPLRRLERAAGPYLVDLGAPYLFGPLPGLLLRIVLIGHRGNSCDRVRPREVYRMPPRAPHAPRYGCGVRNRRGSTPRSRAERNLRPARSLGEVGWRRSCGRRFSPLR